MLYNVVVRSILPRVHWSEEELAEGAFTVGVPNATMPHHHTTSNVTRTVIEGVNKTVTTVIGVMGDVARDIMEQVLHPSPKNVPLSPTTGGESGDHNVVSGPKSPTVPSEVKLILKVVFVLFTTFVRDRQKFFYNNNFLKKIRDRENFY